MVHILIIDIRYRIALIQVCNNFIKRSGLFFSKADLYYCVCCIPSCTNLYSTEQNFLEHRIEFLKVGSSHCGDEIHQCERIFHTYNGSSGSMQLTSFLAVTLLPKLSSAEHQHIHFRDFQHWIGLNRSLQLQAGFQLRICCSRCWTAQDTGGSVGPVCCLCMCVCMKGALVKYGNS